MSVFTLSKAAPFFFKDPRTLRRWCEQGRVPGAYQTKGGHWRIRAKSAWAIKPRINGFARMGKGSGMPLKELASLARLARRPYLKAAMAACDALIDSEQLAAIVDMDDLAKGSWKAADGTDTELIKIRAVKFWILKALDQEGRSSVTAIARASGLPRNTFVRHFSEYISGELCDEMCAAFPRLDELVKQMQPEKAVYYDDRDDSDGGDNGPWWQNAPDPNCGFDMCSSSRSKFYQDIDESLGWKEPNE